MVRSKFTPDQKIQVMLESIRTSIGTAELCRKHDTRPQTFQDNADSLLAMTKKQAGKSPRNFITDGLPAYGKSSRRVFGNGTNHVRHIHLTGKRDHDNNNKMERPNGEIRDREKVFRGLKRMDTTILAGMRVYYNYTKKHGALKGKTPADASGISVEGANKWKTIIQNSPSHCKGRSQ